MNFFQWHIPGTPRSSPSKEVGGSGTPIYGGFVDDGEKSSKLTSANKHKTAADILTNISVIAASVRYFLNLLSNPDWAVEPADDSAEAKELAEFVESAMADLPVSWTRLVRRVGMYRFHGFSIHEWTSIKREDGRIVFTTIDSRPQHTIERWERNDNDDIIGVWQRKPQGGIEVPIDRWKLIYLVDDTLTDNPEGLGWFRHLVDPAERLKEYLKLEKTGYERNLAGIPVGRAPITGINRSVKNKTLTEQEGKTLLKGLTDFVSLELKQKNTGLILDSQTFESVTSEGTQPSATEQWGIELLTGDASGIAELGEAIKRLNVEMARIIGTENIFTGEGGSGSLALSKDKSANLYLNVQSTLTEMAEQFNHDFIEALWALNGLDKKLMPKFKPEDVAFKDVESIAGVLRDMALAGAVLSPDDPAIDDMRDMLGVSRQPDPVDIAETPPLKPKPGEEKEVIEEEEEEETEE